MKWLKRALIVFAVLLLAYVSLSAYGAYRCATVPRLPLTASSEVFGQRCSDVSFTSREDNVSLEGWFIQGAGRGVIVIVHGGFQNRVDENVDTLALARGLNDKGFSLLLFDLRGRGESEGRGRTLCNINRDYGGAVDYLKSRGYEAGEIAFLGFCSGAASTAIFASEEELGGVVLDGCFATVMGMFRYQAEENGVPGPVAGLFTRGVFTWLRIFYRYQPVDPVERIGDARCPVMMVYEESDKSIPYRDQEELIEAGHPVDFWMIPGAEHSQGYRAVPDEYIERVGDFFRAALAL